MNAIETRGLTRSFGARLAVDNLDLTVEKGKLLALLGQNGAGKTTTIRMLCCLIPPTAGDAWLLGDSVTARPEAVKRKINLSPQETAVAPNLSVEENLIFIARVYGAAKEEARARAIEQMGLLGLTERARDKAKTLSGGMQRRLSIAMALITGPDILFLDEPTLGLDVRARRALWQVLEGLKGKMTLVLTTHSMEEAEALCDTVAILHGGKLRAAGTVEELNLLAGHTSFEETYLSLTEEEVAT